MIDRLRAAAEALSAGDPAPFAALFAEGAEWRGITSGHLWWKHTPSCHGPGEVRKVLEFQARERGGRFPRVAPEFTQIGDKIIGATHWTDESGRTRERYQVLTVRDGSIADMQGFVSRRDAERFARRS